MADIALVQPAWRDASIGQIRTMTAVPVNSGDRLNAAGVLGAGGAWH
jgi:hypothetical protein